MDLRAVLLGFLLAWLHAFPALAQITSISHPDSLLVTHRTGCIPLEEARPKFTPADLSLAVRDCLRKMRYDDAIQLFFLYSVYGYFDAKRMTDRSAAAAIGALNHETLGDISARQKTGFLQAMERLQETDGDLFQATCATVERIGPPDYVPIYMLAHGLSAIRFDGGEPVFMTRAELTKKLRPSNRNRLWEEALKDVNGCP